MAYLVVVTFPNEEDAPKARELLKSTEKDGYAKIDDSAVISKDMDGNLKVNNQVSKGAAVSTLIGGVFGMLIGSIIFPVVGTAIGAGAGALFSKLLGLGIDKKFVQEVQEDLKPGSSALFVKIGGNDPSHVVATLETMHGKVYHTNLPYEVEETLRKEMEG
jgi:uncharacterized membrane protein